MLDYIYKNFEDSKCDIKDFTRSTNFKDNYEHSCLTIRSKSLITTLTKLVGIPRGKKSNIITKPNIPFSEYDFVRGYLDADGAIGVENTNGQPFVTMVISSEEFKEYICDFLCRELGIIKRMKRNTRDNVYNICIFNEHAQELVRKLYYSEDALFLNRKYEKVKEVLAWNRPEGIKRSPNKRLWTEEEDQVVLSNTNENASALLNRSIKSIQLRRWRLCPPSSKTTFNQKHYTSEDDNLILTLPIQEVSILLNRSEYSLTLRKRKLLKKM